MKFEKGAMIKTFKHAVTAGLAGVAMAMAAAPVQAQQEYADQTATQPAKPWASDSGYQAKLQAIQQKGDLAAETAQARYNTKMTQCSSRFASGLGQVQRHRQRDSRGGYTGLENIGQILHLGGVSAQERQCAQTAAGAYKQALSSAELNEIRATEALDRTYSQKFRQAERQGGRAGATAQTADERADARFEAQQRRICEQQKLAVLQMKKNARVNPECNAILGR